MLGRTVLRTLAGTLVAAAMLAGAAQADDDFSLRLRFDSGERSYVNGQVYGYGLYGNPYYYDYGYGYGYQPGLSLSYRDGDFSADFGNRLYTGRNRHRNRHNNYYNDFSYGYGETSSHPNDRGGYRLFIPRGLESGSERVLPDSQYLGLPQAAYRSHRGNCWDGCGCGGYGSGYGGYYSGGYPLVIQYGYPVMGLGYQDSFQQQRPLYTAPDYPELGYYRDRNGSRDRYDDSADTIVNDNSVTNNYYYYGDGGASGAALPQPPREYREQPEPPAAQPEAAPPVESYSTRFRTQTRLELADGTATLIALDDNGRLSVGPEQGPAQTVSAGAQHEFGCFATYHSQHGLTLVFREGDTIMGAYQDGNGWWSEALSADVDFASDVSISTMNGEPWLKFSNLGGQRVIMKFADGVWQTVGYGNVGNK
ncbi:hypothetical protein KDL44_03255 [bacterium]|nr:hypothetical protein [bacterium]